MKHKSPHPLFSRQWTDENGTDRTLALYKEEIEDEYAIYSNHNHYLSVFKDWNGQWSEKGVGVTERSLLFGEWIKTYADDVLSLEKDEAVSNE